MRIKINHIAKIKGHAGFTLIELLVVIAIIGLLASIVLISLNSARAKARDAKRIADLRQIQTALAMYYDNYNVYPRYDTGSTPSCLNGYAANTTNYAGTNYLPCWNDLGTKLIPYINKLPIDPGSGLYFYRTINSGQGYYLILVPTLETSANTGDNCNGTYYCVKN